MYANRITVDDIIKLYKQNKSLNQIAEEFQVSISEVMSVLLDKGGEEGKEILIQALEEISHLPVRKLVEERQNGMTEEEIANNNQINIKIVKKIFKQYESIIGTRIVERRKSNRRKDLDLVIEEIVQQYRSGITIKELSEKYKCLPISVRTRLDEYIKNTDIDIDSEHKKMFEKRNQKNEKTKKRYTKETPIFTISKVNEEKNLSEEQEKISIEGIMKRYNKGMTIPQIAKDFHTIKNEIIRCLIADGGEQGKIIVMKYYDTRKKVNVPMNEVVQKYNEGLSKQKIAEEYGVDIVTIERKIIEYRSIARLDSFGKKLRKRRDDIDSEIDQIVKLFKEGSTISQIAEKYACSEFAIRDRIEKYQIQTGEDIYKIRSEIIKKRKSNIEDDNLKEDDEIKTPITVFKLASLESICKIIEKYDYTFEQLAKEAKKRGYTLLKETYLKAFEVVRRKEKSKEAEEKGIKGKKGEEVEW